MPPRSLLCAKLLLCSVLLPAGLRAQRPAPGGAPDSLGARRATFARTTVDSARLHAVPWGTPLGQLAGKVAGLRVVSLSGQPGSAPAAVLRGAGGSFASDPLIVVDGVIIRLSLADVNAEDVDRVDIVHGAAGGAAYGADAGNGVIHIITRRGTELRDSETRVRVRSEVGWNALPRRLATSGHHYFQLSADGSAFLLDASGSRSVDDDHIADARYPSYGDPAGTMIRTGAAFTSYVSLVQRRGGTALDISLHDARDEGTMALVDGISRQTARLGADQRIVGHVRVAGNVFIARSSSDEPANHGQNFATTRLLEPGTPLDSVTTSCPSGWPACFVRAFLTANLGPILNPLSQNQLDEDRVRRDRVSGSVAVSYDPLPWLALSARGDADGVEENRSTRSALAGTTGWVRQTLATSDRVSRLTIAGVGRRAFLGGRLVTNTRAELQQERRSNHQNTTLVRQPGPAAASAARRIDADSRGAVVSAWSEYAERFSLDGALRHDRQSVFAAALGESWHSRVGAAYRLSRDVRVPGVSELRFRASHGVAGTPLPELLLFPSLLAGDVTSPPAPLRVPRTRETEYGADVTVSRLSLAYTFAARRDVDQLARVPFAIATGYTNVWANAVALRGSTHELALDARLVEGGSYSWRVGVTGARTRARLAALQVPSFVLPAGRADVLVATGVAPGTLVGDRWIRSRAQLEETIAAGRLSGSASEYVVNEDGYYVSAAAFHTINEVPLRAYRCDVRDPAGTCSQSSSSFVLGTTMPDLDAGVHTSTRWKSLSLDGTVVWVAGGSVYNSARHSAFPAMTDPVVDQAGKPAPSTACPALTVDASCPYSTGRKSISYYAAFYDTGNANEYFVESGSSLKVRELAVQWQLPAGWLARTPASHARAGRLGVVARNLWTRSGYRGFDPEVGNAAANAYAYGVDVGPYPVYRTISATFALDF